MATEADLEIRLSGGESNTAALFSLGGAMSLTRLVSQTGRVLGISGVSYVDASGPAGEGSLSYLGAGRTLVWTPPDSAPGPARSLTVTGRYAVRGPGNEFIVVDVQEPFLLTDDVVAPVALENTVNSLFDDTLAESTEVREYRCQYVYNQHPTDTIPGVVLRLTQPLGTTLSIGADPAGKGGVAAVVSNGGTPVSVVFDTADIAVGDLAPLQAFPVWWRRIIQPETASPINAAFLQVLF